MTIWSALERSRMGRRYERLYSTKYLIKSLFYARGFLSKTPAQSCSPFSLRLSERERAQIAVAAGGKLLGAYIRAQLLGDHAAKRRVAKRPALNDTKLAAHQNAVFSSRFKELSAKRKGLISAQRMERESMQAAQEHRRIGEQRERQVRYRKGLRGFFRQANWQNPED